jgi:hypothetical protein
MKKQRFEIWHGDLSLRVRPFGLAYGEPVTEYHIIGLSGTVLRIFLGDSGRRYKVKVA